MIIDLYRDRFSVEFICRERANTLGGFIASRGYRAAKVWKPSARAVRDEKLVEQIKRIHAENYLVYGVRKMWHEMRRAGWGSGEHRPPDYCA